MWIELNFLYFFNPVNYKISKIQNEMGISSNSHEWFISKLHIFQKRTHAFINVLFFLKIIYKIRIILFHLNTFFVKYISIVLTEMKMTKLFRLSIHVWRLLSFSDCYCFNTMPKGYIVCKCEQFFLPFMCSWMPQISLHHWFCVKDTVQCMWIFITISSFK